MKKFEITINGESQTVLASSPAIAIRQVLGPYRQTVVPDKMKVGDTTTLAVTVTRLPYTRPRPKPRPVVEGIQVGSIYWSEQGRVVVLGMKDGMAKVKVLGDEDRINDILVNGEGQAVAKISALTPNGYQATTVEGQPLEVGDKIHNFSRHLRLEAAARKGREHLDSPAQQDMRAELAGLGL
jgi:hypothetical protein